MTFPINKSETKTPAVNEKEQEEVLPIQNEQLEGGETVGELVSRMTGMDDDPNGNLTSPSLLSQSAGQVDNQGSSFEPVGHTPTENGIQGGGRVKPGEKGGYDLIYFSDDEESSEDEELKAEGGFDEKAARRRLSAASDRVETRRGGGEKRKNSKTTTKKKNGEEMESNENESAKKEVGEEADERREVGEVRENNRMERMEMIMEHLAEGVSFLTEQIHMVGIKVEERMESALEVQKKEIKKEMKERDDRLRSEMVEHMAGIQEKMLKQLQSQEVSSASARISNGVDVAAASNVQLMAEEENGDGTSESEGDEWVSVGRSDMKRVAPTSEDHRLAAKDQVCIEACYDGTQVGVVACVNMEEGRIMGAMYLEKWNKKTSSEQHAVLGTDGKKWDGQVRPGWVKCANHSCSPNSKLIGWVDEKGRQCVAIKTIRRVRENESITVDYGWVVRPGKAPTKCLCGLAECRGTVERVTGDHQTPVGPLHPSTPQPMTPVSRQHRGARGGDARAYQKEERGPQVSGEKRGRGSGTSDQSSSDGSRRAGVLPIPEGRREQVAATAGKSAKKKVCLEKQHEQTKSGGMSSVSRGGGVSRRGHHDGVWDEGGGKKKKQKGKKKGEGGVEILCSEDSSMTQHDGEED